MVDSTTEILDLLYGLAGAQPYNPPSYTCIREFTDNFPKPAPAAFIQELRVTQSAWQPEAPFPKLYTESYRKSILLTL